MMATAYGTDSTDDFDVLTEMTIDEDGVVHVSSVVVVDKREGLPDDPPR